jgi:hypothetical protein
MVPVVGVWQSLSLAGVRSQAVGFVLGRVGGMQCMFFTFNLVYT